MSTNYLLAFCRIIICYFIMHQLCAMDFMNFIPNHEAAFFLAVGLKENIKAQELLQTHPTININRCDHLTNTPYTLLACRNSDNAEMLALLLNRGFIFTPYLKQEFLCILKDNKPKPALIKLFLQHSVLNYLTTHEQVSAFITLIKQLNYCSPEEQQECLELFVSSNLTITTDQARTLLFTLLGEYLTRINLELYSKYLTSNTINYPLEQLEKKRIWSIILRGLTLLEKHKTDLCIKQPDYNALMQILVHKGCIELIIYLLHKTTILDTHTLYKILASTQKYIPDEQASDFINSTLVNSFLKNYPEHENKIKHALADFLLEHWIKNNSKSAVKLLRRFTTIQRLFTSCTTPEIAHKIAQHDTDSFHNQILGYLPSYEQVQKFIAQKILL